MCKQLITRAMVCAVFLSFGLSAHAALSFGATAHLGGDPERGQYFLGGGVNVGVGRGNVGVSAGVGTPDGYLVGIKGHTDTGWRREGGYWKPYKPRHRYAGPGQVHERGNPYHPGRRPKVAYNRHTPKQQKKPYAMKFPIQGGCMTGKKDWTFRCQAGVHASARSSSFFFFSFSGEKSAHASIMCEQKKGDKIQRVSLPLHADIDLTVRALVGKSCSRAGYVSPVICSSKSTKTPEAAARVLAQAIRGYTDTKTNTGLMINLSPLAKAELYHQTHRRGSPAMGFESRRGWRFNAAVAGISRRAANECRKGLLIVRERSQMIVGISIPRYTCEKLEMTHKQCTGYSSTGKERYRNAGVPNYRGRGRGKHYLGRKNRRDYSTGFYDDTEWASTW